MKYLNYALLSCLVVIFSQGNAQQSVKFISQEKEKKVDVLIDGKLFTSYLYTDNIDKPVLFPLISSSGITLTRGFPLSPRPNERTDHPHHVGMWFNYGDVNDLDFWNNSYAIETKDKSKYGSIRHRKIIKMQDGKTKGTLVIEVEWVDFNEKVLLKEQTTFVFSGKKGERTIDRTTVLTAVNDKVSFKDNKEGVLGIRVCRELEMPADKPEIFTDAQGNPTTVAIMNNEGVTGNYLTSEGKTGNDAWGTRGKWCLLSGTKNGVPVSIGIIDHPTNPGYPTYWHARGYGLFAANTLGQEALSGGKEKLGFDLEKGASVKFRYEVLLEDGKVLSKEELNKKQEGFGG